MGRKSRLKRDDPERRERVKAAHRADLARRMRSNEALLMSIFGPKPDGDDLKVGWEDGAHANG